MNQFEKKILMSGALKALDYIQGIEIRDVAPSAQALKNLEAFDEDLTPGGIDALETIEFLDDIGSPGTMASNGNRYFGFVIGGSHPAALAANWLASAWDQNAGLVAGGPAASVAEERAGTWVLDLLGLPTTASFALVTGCQMAHFTALAAARHHVLTAAGWDLPEQGLAGAPPVS